MSASLDKLLNLIVPQFILNGKTEENKIVCTVKSVWELN